MYNPFRTDENVYVELTNESVLTYWYNNYYFGCVDVAKSARGRCCLSLERHPTNHVDVCVCAAGTALVCT